MGAVGKSAQVPLARVAAGRQWEGPTPVSALIHAATMVTAGVYMMARSALLYDVAPVALDVVAVVGVLTALFAASMALVAADIKRVLAYSTVSQLGFMVFALGVGAWAAAIFHLVTHAFFKALLFLGAGSGHPRPRRRAGHAPHGRPATGAADDALDDGDGHPGDCGDFSLRRVLEQRRDSGQRHEGRAAPACWDGLPPRWRRS